MCWRTSYYTNTLSSYNDLCWCTSYFTTTLSSYNDLCWRTSYFTTTLSSYSDLWLHLIFYDNIGQLSSPIFCFKNATILNHLKAGHDSEITSWLRCGSSSVHRLTTLPTASDIEVAVHVWMTGVALSVRNPGSNQTLIGGLSFWAAPCLSYSVVASNHAYKNEYYREP